MEVQGKALEWFYCLLLREGQGQEDILATELHKQVSLKSPSELKPLLDGGLITISRKGRSKYAAVTDAGWRWAHAQLGRVASRITEKRGSTKSDREMLASLFRVLDKLVQQGGALAPLLAPASCAPSPTGDTDPFASLLATLKTLGASGQGARVPLAALKREMSPLAPERVDALLLDLLTQQRVSLEANYDISTISEEDRRAAIRLGTAEKHFVILIP